MGATTLQLAPPRTAYDERNEILGILRNRSLHAGNQIEGAAMMDTFLAFALLIFIPLSIAYAVDL